MAKMTNARGPAPGMLAISEIMVAGFKSLSDEQSIEIRPLTILAGANSSGKSSIMQPLLLLKQTLEASYDAGPLLLSGPNVKFTSADQLLSRIGRKHSSADFRIGARLDNGDHFQTTFRKENKLGFRIDQMEFEIDRRQFTFWPEMTQAEVIKTGLTKDSVDATPEGFSPGRWTIMRDRCFLGPAWVAKHPEGGEIFETAPWLGAVWENIIPRIIHLPGLRGNPERAYPVAAVGGNYSGTFQTYTASVICAWQEESPKTIEELNSDLVRLTVTGGVTAARLNGVQIELWVGRLPDVTPDRLENRVNIADVGIGISQTLPVLVALRAAKPGQLVYVEQPETHLHPRAQFALAQILAAAANRGVRVVVETHSSILLLGVQTLVAEGSLTADKVKLHWFQREKDGRTVIQSGDLDEAGRFGNWPEDFDDVSLKAESRFLDAAEAKLAQK
jgi:hypothetical protein